MKIFILCLSLFLSNLIVFSQSIEDLQKLKELRNKLEDVGETVENACVREAKEETNINVNIIKLIGVFSNPKRDPRGHNVTIGFLCEPSTDKEKPKAMDDAAALEIVPLSKIPSLKLAFDHKEIIESSGMV